jgi:hypothetical protein
MTENHTEMFLYLSEEVRQLCTDNDILKTKMEIISATERLNVTRARVTDVV